ncbi:MULTISPECIES: Imm10 family immunity protein [unclassified Streptomyces]|uniref:Imm10 family immunity protein n=1 Tax=unclassified Streptomyces TaxID=2593676 RepID=UPI000DB9B602|nr:MULTISPECIES: Imm10 family immunity protein [unclassified Streptomyces]MYT70032.1 hypothetical protein [Streptomyces sp. SID8367]RAJ88605.1 immunity protein 10 of polymorphic toxin system [Streptomyces sp. PsTaAH-137]
MTYRFTALLAFGVDDPEVDDCPMAGVAESGDEDGFSLFFMCDFGEPDAQEVSLGMDTHCLVTPDQGTAYGCVQEVWLSDGLLRVTLDPGALGDLGLTDPVVEAVLRAPAEDLARLRDVLPRILRYGRPEARPRMISG